MVSVLDLRDDRTAIRFALLEKWEFMHGVKLEITTFNIPSYISCLHPYCLL